MYNNMNVGMDLDYILKFKELIETDFKHHKKQSYYALQLNISRQALHQKSANVVGKGPKQIIDEIVMEKAKQLLIQSNDGIKDVALILGFYDPTNFNKFFHKHNKDTPLQFRKRSKYHR